MKGKDRQKNYCKTIREVSCFKKITVSQNIPPEIVSREPLIWNSPAPAYLNYAPFVSRYLYIRPRKKMRVK